MVDNSRALTFEYFFCVERHQGTVDWVDYSVTASQMSWIE